MPEAQDPLAQLRDIHLPEAVGLWPLAPGWWILIALFLALVAGSIWYWRKRVISMAFKREALSQLEALNDLRDNNGLQYVQALNALLKQTALTAHARAEVAALSGQQWLEYLDQHFSQSAFVSGAGRCLADAPYKPSLATEELSALHLLAQQWISEQPGVRR